MGFFKSLPFQAPSEFYLRFENPYILDILGLNLSNTVYGSRTVRRMNQPNVIKVGFGTGRYGYRSPYVFSNRYHRTVLEKYRSPGKQKSQMPEGTLKRIICLPKVVPENQALRKSQKSKKRQCFGES